MLCVRVTVVCFGAGFVSAFWSGCLFGCLCVCVFVRVFELRVCVFDCLGWSFVCVVMLLLVLYCFVIVCAFTCVMVSRFDLFRVVLSLSFSLSLPTLLLGFVFACCVCVGSSCVLTLLVFTVCCVCCVCCCMFVVCYYSVS